MVKYRKKFTPEEAKKTLKKLSIDCDNIAEFLFSIEHNMIEENSLINLVLKNEGGKETIMKSLQKKQEKINYVRTFLK